MKNNDKEFYKKLAKAFAEANEDIIELIEAVSAKRGSDDILPELTVALIILFRERYPHSLDLIVEFLTEKKRDKEEYEYFKSALSEELQESFKTEPLQLQFFAEPMVDERWSEIEDKLSSYTESGINYTHLTPLFRGLEQREEDTTEPTILNVFSQGDLTISQGHISVFEKAMLDSILKAKHEDCVLSNGYFVFDANRFSRWLFGNPRPSEKQIETIENGLIQLGYRRIDIMTNEELASYFNITDPEDIERLKMYDMQNTIINEQFFTCSVIRDRKIKGQPTKRNRVFLIKFHEKIEPLILDTIHWSVAYHERFKQVKAYNENGELIEYRMTPDKVALHTYLSDFIFSYMNTRTDTPTSPARFYSDKKTYKQIFNACKVDVETPMQRARRREQVRTILDHFVNEGLLESWTEYGKGDKAGIQIKVPPELYETELKGK